MDNTAKLSDIISTLQGLTTINARADLASVIGSPALGTDPMATLVSLIQGNKDDLVSYLQSMGQVVGNTDPLASLISLLTGMNVSQAASGDITSGIATGATVNNLLFRPKTLNMALHNTASNYYANFIRFDNPPIVYQNMDKILWYNSAGMFQTAASVTLSLTDNGFTFTSPSYGSDTTLRWWAFG